MPSGVPAVFLVLDKKTAEGAVQQTIDLVALDAKRLLATSRALMLAAPYMAEAIFCSSEILTDALISPR